MNLIRKNIDNRKSKQSGEKNMNLKKESEENLKVEKIFDYVLDLGTFTELDYDFAEQFITEKYDGWGGMCSAAATVTKDGTTLVGRNMDLYTSNKAAYISRTKVEGCHETVGLTYIHMFGPDYEDALKNGISEDTYKLLPFFATDVLNSEGLYVETNMRFGEENPDGTSKFSCSGTNPDSNTRICSLALPRYIGEHCATVDEALEYVKTLNIYTTNGSGFAWNFCFVMSDATGHFGLLEIAENKISWLDGQHVQTNFYVTEEFAKKQELKCGVGRYELLINGIKNVQSEQDMFNLINQVTCYQSYFPEICGYDPRSEFVGAHEIWTYDYVSDDANREEVIREIREQGERMASCSREELQNQCNAYESIFTEVVNCKEKTLTVRFFEDDARTAILSFKN